MEKQINHWISKAEDRWLNLLQSHAATVFAGTFLPSHDQDHHLRVWNWCRIILQDLAPNTSLTPEILEGVMIAAWFHDLGMVQSMEESHGSIGSKMCESFFRKNRLALPPHFMEIKEAIENHDTKEATIYDTFLPGAPPKILSIISVADDLDALGNVGIYRFTEIYLHREVPMQELGIRVLRNASLRYRNVCRSLAGCPGLVLNASKLFSTLESFFNLYNQQMLTKKKVGQVLSGQVGIVNHIRKYSVDGDIHPVNYMEECDWDGYGKTVHAYFMNLKNELEKVPAH